MSKREDVKLRFVAPLQPHCIDKTPRACVGVEHLACGVQITHDFYICVYLVYVHINVCGYSYINSP